MEKKKIILLLHGKFGHNLCLLENKTLNVLTALLKDLREIRMDGTLLCLLNVSTIYSINKKVNA